MRPMVVVDETFLKNKYSGILYDTTCLDMNEQIYSLVFVIGLSENDALYLCFFLRFKKAYRDYNDLIFIR